MPSRPDITTVARPSPMRRTQTTFTVVALGVAIIWCVFHAVRGDQSIYNPAQVALVHKNFEQQCWQCHDGGPNGLISQRVSDTACLKCHSAAIHSANQKMGAGHSHAELVVAVSGDKNYPGGMRSSDCVACHVEHKGHEALAARTDESCTLCHANLKDHVASVTTAANSVTAFATDQHPAFGRTLLQNGKYLNTTVLKYNHLFHTQQGVGDCQSCHKPSTDHKGYMQPVMFAASCEKCHIMRVEAGNLSVQVIHQDLAKVRQQIAALPGMYFDSTAHANNRLEFLYKKTLPASPLQKKRILAAAKPEDFYGNEEYVQKQLDAFATLLNSMPAEYPQLQKLRAVLGPKPPTFVATTQASTARFNAPNQDLIEYYIAFSGVNGRINRCVLCHSMTGDFSSVVAAKKSPDTTLLVTDPTRVAPVTFISSKFDHEAHKAQTCVSCHTNVDEYKPANSDGSKIDAAKSVALDKELRGKQPLAWDTEQLGETSRLLSPTAISSCTSCHNPPASPGHTASSSCVTCHDYHDRRLERLTSVAVSPSAVAASP